ncbi:MAG: hypothetical protein WCD18_16325, partial [Thermosynechococcaceae cyanobacterium]
MPLCLPFLLGSATLRTAAPTASVVAAPPPSLSHLFSEHELSTAHQLTLPSQTLTSLSSQTTRPQPNRPTAAKAPASPAQKPLQKSSPQPAPPAEPRLAKATAPQPAKNLPPIPIRVAIAREAKTIDVATSDAGVVVDANGHVIG